MGWLRFLIELLLTHMPRFHERRVGHHKDSEVWS
jgi:hypothetical protein